MTDRTPVDFQPGQLSGFGYAIQSAKGTPAGSPTDVIQTTGFGFMNNPNPIFQEALNGSFDAVVGSAAGFRTVGAKLSAAFWANQLGLMLTSIFQRDILTGASPVSFGTITANSAIGDDHIIISADPPAAPTGTEWPFTFITVGTGAGAETLPVFSYVSGTKTVYTWPLKKAHTSADTVSAPVQHQLCAATSNATIAVWQYLSLWLQFGKMNEVQMQDVKISNATMKGSSSDITWDLTLPGDSPVKAYTSTLTGLAPAGVEAGDKFWTAAMGAIYAKVAQADVNLSGHLGLQTWQFDINMNPSAQKVGGYTTEQNINMKRTMGLTWTALSGPLGVLPPIQTEFVDTQADTPACIVFLDSINNVGFILGMPRARYQQYIGDDPGPNPLTVSGSLQALPDATTGKSVKLTLLNGTTTKYGA